MGRFDGLFHRGGRAWRAPISRGFLHGRLQRAVSSSGADSVCPRRPCARCGFGGRPNPPDAAARFAPVLVVELSAHVAARGGVHEARRKGGEDLMCRREWRRPNTPGRSDLDLICALRVVLPARGPASTASAGSREKVLPIRTKVLTSIARCCGPDTIKIQDDVAQCGSCGACGRRVGTGAADRPALCR